jgi:hypothetical protein
VQGGLQDVALLPKNLCLKHQLFLAPGVQERAGPLFSQKFAKEPAAPFLPGVAVLLLGEERTGERPERLFFRC